MGNPTLSYPTDKPTPCRECREFHGTGIENGPYVACAQNPYFRRDPELGCKYWTQADKTWAERSAGRRIIVCGGREYADRVRAYAALDALLDQGPIAVIVEGGAPGADTMARQWAVARGIPYEEHAADWQALGPKAGPIRNQEMVDAGADGVVAFPGGIGTADCCRRAEAAGIKVWRPYG